MLRYGLEKDLLEGKLAVRDLPEAWNQGMADRLEVRPANDTEGCLQDIHWAKGSFGYFPTYAIGGVIGAQLWESLRARIPEVDTQIVAGDFNGITRWLGEQVHGHGARLPLQELMKAATGKPLGAQAALRYLEAKYVEDTP